MLADARAPSAIRPRVLADAAPARTPVAATRAQIKDRVVRLSRSSMLEENAASFDGSHSGIVLLHIEEKPVQKR
jgi:hypothetical protein